MYSYREFMVHMPWFGACSQMKNTSLVSHRPFDFMETDNEVDLRFNLPSSVGSLVPRVRKMLEANRLDRAKGSLSALKM